MRKDRAYRSEDDVFEDYTQEERDHLFSIPPATVWENLQALKNFPEKRAVVTAGGALRDQIIDAFVSGGFIRWKTEIISRIIPENRVIVSACKGNCIDFRDGSGCLQLE